MAHDEKDGWDLDSAWSRRLNSRTPRHARKDDESTAGDQIEPEIRERSDDPSADPEETRVWAAEKDEDPEAIKMWKADDDRPSSAPPPPPPATTASPESTAATARVEQVEPEAEPTVAQTAVPSANSAPPPPTIPPSERNDRTTTEDFFDDEDDMSDNRRARWPWVLLVAALLLGGAYVGAAMYFGDRVPTGTTVSGVDIGGLTRDEAISKVESDLGDQLIQPVAVTVEGTDITGEIDPIEAGVTVDGEATVDPLVKRSFAPQDLWRHLSGADQVSAVVTFDDAALRETVADLNSKIEAHPVDATLSFNGSQVERTPAQEGTGIAIERAAEILGRGWLTEPRPIAIPAESIQPEITDADVDAAISTYAAPLTQSPLKVKVGEEIVTLSQTDLASAASFANHQGEIAFTLDGARLYDIVDRQGAGSLPAPVDAKIILEDGAPKVVESQNGQTLDAEATTTAITDAALTSTREVEAVVIEEEPELTTAEANELGVKEVVSEIETPLTNDSVRTTNLEVGSSRVSGVLIMPGERFSLLEHLGEITEENGYVSSGVVMDGFNSTALGGGLSQLSTNMFNIGYWGGMSDIYHQPHSKYFDRYPMGVESTLWVPDVDMIWENNSPYAVMIESWVADGFVHSRLWSTKYYDVEINVAGPYNVHAPEVRVNDAPDCVPSGAGGNGFSVDVSRTVKHEGELVDSNEYTWTYQPVHAVQCG